MTSPAVGTRGGPAGGESTPNPAHRARTPRIAAPGRPRPPHLTSASLLFAENPAVARSPRTMTGRGRRCAPPSSGAAGRPRTAPARAAPSVDTSSPACWAASRPSGSAPPLRTSERLCLEVADGSDRHTLPVQVGRGLLAGGAFYVLRAAAPSRLLPSDGSVADGKNRVAARASRRERSPVAAARSPCPRGDAWRKLP